jgi:hypothetical protein
MESDNDTAATAADTVPAYVVEHIPPSLDARFAPQTRKYSFFLGEHSLTVQTGAVCDQVKAISPNLRACLHLESASRGRLFLGVVTSPSVHKDQATIGDLQALVASVQLRPCVDCTEHFLINPLMPNRAVCRTCFHLRKTRLAGDILIGQREHLSRRRADIQKACDDGMTHVVIRKKDMLLNLERFVRLPPLVRNQLCTLEVYRFTFDTPYADDFVVPFCAYEGPLDPPEQAVVMTVQEFLEQTVQRQAAVQNLMRGTKGLRDRAGVSMMKQIQRLKVPSPSTSISRSTPARARPRRVSILRQLAELAR